MLMCSYRYSTCCLWGEKWSEVKCPTHSWFLMPLRIGQHEHVSVCQHLSRHTLSRNGINKKRPSSGKESAEAHPDAPVDTFICSGLQLSSSATSSRTPLQISLSFPWTLKSPHRLCHERPSLFSLGPARDQSFTETPAADQLRRVLGERPCADDTNRWWGNHSLGGAGSK